MEPLARNNQLLPRSKADFASKEYWDRFFTKRTAAFEWYGEYHQISPTIFKYTKQNDKLLVLGCGNSTMSYDLYKSGYTSVVSIDISDVVIAQMKKKYPKLDFRLMDATKLEFADLEIGHIIDKGTTDALLPKDSRSEVDTMHKVFNEVARCLRFGGRFICVSLLQDHVARTIFDYFKEKGTQDTTWVVRVHRCTECETSDSTLILPVYIVVCTKMKRLPAGACVLELMVGDKPVRYRTVEEICKEIKDQQNYAFMKNHINRTNLTEEFHTQLFTAEDDQNPKYDLFIVDTPDVPTQTKMACFLVPEGRDVEWLYGTPEGRKITARQCSAFRVVFVHLNRRFHHGSQQEIQNELSDAVLQLVPRNFKQGSQIPFLSLGDAVGTRTIVEEGHSDLSGEFVVEDVRIDGETYRRLIFCGRRSVIQTEMRVGTDGKLDFGYLASGYYRYMLDGLGYFDKPGKALQLGLGGGSLASWVSKLTQWDVEAVEYDPAIVRVARTHFGLPDEVKVHVLDALQFIAESSEKYDIIWLDIDSKDVGQSMTCPPEEFLEENFLTNVIERLTGRGIFIVNLACRDESKRLEAQNKLKAKFKYLSTANVPEYINKVIMASNFELTDYKAGIANSGPKTSEEEKVLLDLYKLAKDIDLTKL